MDEHDANELAHSGIHGSMLKKNFLKQLDVFFIFHSLTESQKATGAHKTIPYH